MPRPMAIPAPGGKRPQSDEVAHHPGQSEYASVRSPGAALVAEKEGVTQVDVHGLLLIQCLSIRAHCYPGPVKRDQRTIRDPFFLSRTDRPKQHQTGQKKLQVWKRLTCVCYRLQQRKAEQ